jgi:hypothetical protein
MNSSTQFNNEGLVVDAIINSGAVFAYDSQLPRLVIPIELKEAVKAPEGIAFELNTLYAVLRCGHGQDRDLIAEAIPEPIEQMAQVGARHVQLTFPLDHERLHRIEKIRAGGAQLQFSLFLKLSARKLGIIPLPANQPKPASPAFVYYKGFTCQSYDINLYIPRDRWLSVLETTKFGSIHVFEFPAVPIEYQESLGNAFAALREAKRLHQMGFYDKAVGECRIALDKFWDEKPKRLKDEWKAYMGEGEHKWLDEAFTAIRRGSNEPHHNARAGHDQFESLVFINLTASLVSYVARLGVAEREEEEER